MKRIMALLCTAILMIAAVGCDKAASAPKYENLLVTGNTVECDRFGMKYEVPGEFAILTDDILELAGDLDYDIQTGESYTVDGEEIPLRSVAMVTDFTNNEYITFKTSLLEEGATIADTADKLVTDLGEVTFSGLQEIKLLGTDGYTFSLVKSFEDTTFYYVGYMLQNGDYLLTIMCSGGEFPVNTTESVVTQFAE